MCFPVFSYQLEPGPPEAQALLRRNKSDPGTVGRTAEKESGHGEPACEPVGCGFGGRAKDDGRPDQGEPTASGNIEWNMGYSFAVLAALHLEGYDDAREIEWDASEQQQWCHVPGFDKISGQNDNGRQGGDLQGIGTLSEVPPEFLEYQVRLAAMARLAMEASRDAAISGLVAVAVAAGCRKIGILWALYSAVSTFFFVLVLGRLV